LLAREYLQARILESLQDSGAFTRWVFLGGTALRFLYSMPRFSEDLNFSLRDAEAEAGFKEALLRTKRVLSKEGYDLEVRVRDQKNIASAMFGFPGLPYELGVSLRRAQKLSVKVELDTNPPSGAGITTTLVRRHVTLNLCHHDRPSLLAGKVHAVLSRRWTKGRDLFDLAWYLADPNWPPPNLELLNAALSQTGWNGDALTPDNWRHAVRTRIEQMDWERARQDVRPFLESERDLELVTPEALRGLL
jgi:hypothetical protein